jgi:signal transduction histidine kinase/CheY-like chemotaxis protein
MISKAIVALVLLVSFWSCSFASAQSIFASAQSIVPPSAQARLGSGSAALDLTPYLFYLEDPSGQLGIGDVSKADAGFRRLERSTAGFGFSASHYWFRFTVSNQTQLHHSWFLELEYNRIDHFDVYVPDGDGFRQQTLGDQLSFDQRDIPLHTHVAMFSLLPNATKTIYLKVSSEGNLTLPLRIYSARSLLQHATSAMLVQGVYFGIIVAMVFYNLFIFSATRDVSYFYYVCYIACFGFSMLIFSGLSSRYLWPETPWLDDRALLLAIVAALIFACRFTQTFLELSLALKKANYLFWFLIVLLLLISPLVIVADYATVTRSVAVLMAIFALAALFSGLRCWYRGQLSARFYTSAWLVFLLTLLCIYLAVENINILPVGTAQIVILQFGSALEVILLSLGLADRINQMKRQAADAQSQMLVAQELAIKNLEQADKLKDEFISAVTHELRTPMHAVQGSLQLMDHEQRQSALLNTAGIRTTELLNTALTGASSLMQLVEDILIYTELQTHALDLAPRNVSTAAFFTRLARTCQLACDEKGLDLKWKLDQTVPAALYFDDNKLELILKKLLDNAVKFTEKGCISVTISWAQKAGGQLHLDIDDTGIGITEDKIDLIFDPFVQQESGFKRRHDGLGIGLAICNSLIRQLGGELRVASKPDAGTRFTLCLNAALAEQSDSEASAVNSVQQKPQKQKHILVVEDNPTNQLILAKMLSVLGCESVIAANGHEAIALLRAQDFALVFMDLQMPEMDGLSCTRYIREAKDLPNQIPIIAVSANVSEQTQRQCRENGMNGFLEKPVLISSLKDVLDRY